MSILDEFQRSVGGIVDPGLAERHLRIFGVDKEAAVVYSKTAALDGSLLCGSPALKAAVARHKVLDLEPLDLAATTSQVCGSIPQSGKKRQ